MTDINNLREAAMDAARWHGFNVGLNQAMQAVRDVAATGDLHTKLAASVINERLFQLMMQTTSVTSAGERIVSDRSGEDFQIYAMRVAAE